MGKLEIYKYLFLLNSFFLYFRNQSLLSYVKARTHFISLLTYFLLIFLCISGGVPYPTLTNRELCRLLKTGYRMEKPDMGCDEV